MADRSRRYGARSDHDRAGASATDRVVARFRRAAYVAGIVHCWDLRPQPSRSPAVPGGAMMAAAAASTSLVPVRLAFTESERLALAGFLAGYRGLTREAYTLDLRQFAGWCRIRSLP